MRSSLSRYILLAKRWAWLLILGMVICGGITYVITKLLPPTYETNSQVMITIRSSQSQNDNTLAALSLIPTFTKIVTNQQVLEPVAQQHNVPLKQLEESVSASHVSNTILLDISVKGPDPQKTMQIANDVARSFQNYMVQTYNGEIVGTILPAVVPNRPVQPQPLMDAIIGAIVGLGLALALVIVFEWIDDRLSRPEEIQTILGLDLLTIIPQLTSRQRSKNAEETPQLAEGCRILCAHLNMSQMVRPFKLLMVTSAMADEGKSTIAANIASFLAMSGKRVLLVDADLRHPVLDQHFQVDNRHGLSNAFLESWPKAEGILDGQPTEIPTLRVVTAGTLPSNPSELLQSQLAHQVFNYYRNTPKFDYIIFDTPAVLPIADAQVVASYIQATVLVANASKTPRKAILRAKQALSRTGTRVLGVALNKSQWPEFGEVQDYLTDLVNRPRADIAMALPAQHPGHSSIDVANTAAIPMNRHQQ